MTMLPQPPPDAPAPPPSDAALLSRRKWKWLWIVGVGSIFMLALTPIFGRMGRKRTVCGPTAEVNNARQIGLALYEFQIEYGKFPDASTAGEVRKRTGTLLPLGTRTSNDFFRQLLASEVSQGEAMFYFKAAGIRKPDNVFDGAHALAKGECGFTYFVGAVEGGNPSRPLVVAPMIPGTDRFDPKPYDGKAVILKVDNSVTSAPIDKSGHVIIAGKNLMDSSHLIWDGHPPVIAWPDL